jgi:orotidine-5'-phosphate decarboxylase
LNPLIIALDVDTREEALNLVDRLGQAADFYKVGMELYAAGGMNLVGEIHGLGKKVFLDLKLYDIGETVKRATRQIAQSGVVTFLTVHGSRAIMQAAVEGRGDNVLKLLGITVLTSFDEDDLADLGYSVPVAKLVELRLRNSVETGIDGVVCSAREVSRLRALCSPSFLLVTPGVRSPGADIGDQKRVASPREAIEDGSNFLVIGRQVTRAADPKSALEKIVEEIGNAGHGPYPAFDGPLLR